jgi:hypothetical protein
LFGEPPDANIQVFADTFAAQGITGWSSHMQPTVANSARKFCKQFWESFFHDQGC